PGAPVHRATPGQLAAAAVPFTFIGRITEGDDKTINLLSHETINQLYNLLDLYLVTSRSEGGPRAILEAAAANCKIISTPVGLAGDVLEQTAVYPDPPAAIHTIAQDWRANHLASLLPAHRQKVMAAHRPDTVTSYFADLYRQLTDAAFSSVASPSFTLDVQQAYWRAQISQKVGVRSPIRRLWRGWGRPALKRARAIRQKWRARRAPASKPVICLWHEFVKPPYGGGNPFMLALRKGLQARGYTVVENTFSPDVNVYVLNSIHFDVARFLEYARAHAARVIHRIDGPIHLIRGRDREKDELCYAINKEFAQTTIVQSNWTFRQMAATGYFPVNPIVLHNAADPDIFHARGRTSPSPGVKIRLISTSWSDNPRKGGPIYKWIEEHLDWERFDYTFVGRASEPFNRIRQIPPVPSDELAGILRQHDIYIAASQNDPCSNALIEALSCGLPALYLDDGGHPELVGFGGLPFRAEVEILPQLDKLAAHHALFQSLITVSSLAHVIDVYEALIAQVMQVDDVLTAVTPKRCGEREG
ncbi:MAG: glycosyltransferase, partial [Anaerolineae bacterium]